MFELVLIIIRFSFWSSYFVVWEETALLHCTALYRIAEHCTVQHSIIQWCTVLLLTSDGSTQWDHF